jgi:cytosine/adenosine deaminase-related metal-dependent hydrolase
LPLAWSDSLRAEGTGSGTLARRAGFARGRMPFAIHLADGVGDAAAAELDDLERARALVPGTLLVHGVALDPGAGPRLAGAGAALAWCPATSAYLFGATAPVAELRRHIPVALGTDSTMTGSATLLDELRFAAGLSLVGAEALVDMVTRDAARALLLTDRGRIEAGALADLVALPPPARDGAEAALLAATPSSLALVMVGGTVRLAAPRFAAEGDLEPLLIEGRPRYVARGARALIDRIRRALPAGFTSPALALVTPPAGAAQESENR